MAAAFDPVRRFRRFKADFRVKMSYTVAGEQRSEVVRSYEFSQGGVSVYSPVQPHEEQLELEFTLPGQNEALKLRANIRNRRGFRYGMEFTGVTPQQAEALTAYAQRLEQKTGR